MRVLLTSSASFAPPRGGSTRSNRVWLEHLAAHGHACRVVCGTPPAATGEQRDRIAREAKRQGYSHDPSRSDFDLELESGITVSAHSDLPRRKGLLATHVKEFAPDWVLVSSEDLGHALLREASDAAPGRVIYLAHTPQFFPFGPESWNRDEQATERVQQAAAVVAISGYIGQYVADYAGREANVIHPPLYGSGPWEHLGNFHTGDVLIVNPCAVKGISLFLSVAAALPDTPFAALAGWGTTSEDRDALSSLPNVRVIEPVKRIKEVLSQTRVLLMPSLWAEGFGLIVMEAMLQGIPVISSDSGGLEEAKAGTGYVLPVEPIREYLPAFDEVHMPRPVIPKQDPQPWIRALRELCGNRDAYEAESARSRVAALRFVNGLRAGDFERFLLALEPRQSSATKGGLLDRIDRLPPDQRALLMARLKAARARS